MWLHPQSRTCRGRHPSNDPIRDLTPRQPQYSQQGRKVLGFACRISRPSVTGWVPLSTPLPVGTRNAFRIGKGSSPTFSCHPHLVPNSRRMVCTCRSVGAGSQSHDSSRRKSIHALSFWLMGRSDGSLKPVTTTSSASAPLICRTQHVGLNDCVLSG